ncbi:MAG: exopolyphosphatase [Chloroflexi bacterium]|nr:exopolyphosphatase [Chloroflexota bacterium]
MAADKKYNLVTRSDFDGLVCAVLLKEMGIIGDIKFVHPKDVQDGKAHITGDDITTNLPYVEGAYLAFDHHLSETIRIEEAKPNHIIDPDAPSAARVVYNFFRGEVKLLGVSKDMLTAVDKADSGRYSLEDVLHPGGWDLLSFIMDARTGLGRFKEFRVSNYELMMNLIDYCRTHAIDDILNLPDVKERAGLYFEHEAKAKEQIKRCAAVHKNLVVLDLRGEGTIYAVNRFMIYALLPQCNISMHVVWGVKKQNTAFAVGNSIFNRTSKTNIGELMLTYGGGGHANAGTCQVENDKADRVLKLLIAQITANG